MAKLVSLRGPLLQAHATRLLGNAEQARDAVQDAWVEILRGIPALRDDRAFPAWAYRIVTRRCARTISRLQRDRKMAEHVRTTQDTACPDTAGNTSDARTVRQALRALPPGHAATIALFYLEDMSVAEVAAALDIPAGTVKTRLMHARDKLRNILKGDLDELEN